MTVRELVEALDGFDPWVALDEEGWKDGCDNNPADAFEHGARLTLEHVRKLATQ